MCEKAIAIAFAMLVIAFVKLVIDLIEFRSKK